MSCVDDYGSDEVAMLERALPRNPYMYAPVVPFRRLTVSGRRLWQFGVTGAQAQCFDPVTGEVLILAPLRRPGSWQKPTVTNTTLATFVRCEAAASRILRAFSRPPDADGNPNLDGGIEVFEEVALAVRTAVNAIDPATAVENSFWSERYWDIEMGDWETLAEE